jgi:thymidylate synthase ThyX
MDVFCLLDEDGRILPPAVQATVLAKYSRSPLSARDLLHNLKDDEADKFQEKWVVEYGHNSVNELAVIPICMENISIIASKFVESFPRGGYSEKSTRYQKFNSNSFVTPPGLSNSLSNFSKSFYDAYEEMTPEMTRICAEKMEPLRDSSSISQWNKKITARVFDNLRYLLPAGTGTNVACVLNMRDARDLICQSRGHMNPEIRAIGDAVCEAVSRIAPSLIKHTEPRFFNLPVKSLGDPIPFKSVEKSWTVQFSKYGYHGDPLSVQEWFKNCVWNLHGMDWSTFDRFMQERSSWEGVPDIFNRVRISFDILMDYGAYRDLQRHRRCNQMKELLGTNYGFLVPDDIIGSSLESRYKDIMGRASSFSSDEIKHDPEILQYVIPMGFLHRSEFDMDLQQLYYMVELRTKPHGHISYRRVAYEMYEKAKSQFPELMKWCRAIPPSEVGIHHLSIRRPYENFSYVI